MSETRYLTAAEAAERLGVSLRTVRRRIADGSLPSVKLGGAVRVAEAALMLHGTHYPLAGEAGSGAATGEAAAAYAPTAEEEATERYIRSWNRAHWPDTWDSMVARRRDAIARILELARHTRPAEGPQDTVDAMLNQVRDELGARLLPQPPVRGEDRP